MTILISTRSQSSVLLVWRLAGLSGQCWFYFVSPQLSCQESIGDHNVALQLEVSPCYGVNISSWTHIKGLLKMCAGPCSPLAALWKWQGLRFSPLQDQVKSIKIYYSYGSVVTSLKAPVISEEKGEKELVVNFGFSSFQENIESERPCLWNSGLDNKIGAWNMVCQNKTYSGSGFSEDISLNMVDKWMQKGAEGLSWCKAHVHVQQSFHSYLEEN